MNYELDELDTPRKIELNNKYNLILVMLRNLRHVTNCNTFCRAIYYSKSEPNIEWPVNGEFVPLIDKYLPELKEYRPKDQGSVSFKAGVWFPLDACGLAHRISILKEIGYKIVDEFYSL